jgi:hypothetical protein
MSVDERTVLRHVLSDYPVLHAQVDKAKVVRLWALGSTSIDLHVPDDSPPCDNLPSPLSFPIADDAGTFTGWLLVWLEHGRLSALEHAWVTDEQPTELPPARQIGKHDGDTLSRA